MLPPSDALEAFHARAKKAASDLKKLAGAEVTAPALKTELAAIAREWLKLSPAIRHASICKPDRLDAYDKDMQEMLASTTTRARASALRAKVVGFVEDGIDDVIVPLITHEGSPRQVAARQIQGAFANIVSPDEAAYIEEAARCVTVLAFRAALIMLWAAAIARIHAAIEKRGWSAYNAAVDATKVKAGNPFSRIKDNAKVSSHPELQKSRDADILIVGMELFGYDLQIYQELDRLLGTRNDAAHPGQAQPGALDVQQFANKLADFVFQRINR